jgi:hypothetical protein
MAHYEIEPGEYDGDTNDHGALRATETQLRRPGDLVEQQTAVQQGIADALSRLESVLGALSKAITHRG